MRKYTLVGAALLAAASFTAVGCGSSSPSAKDQINKIVNEGNTTPSTVCDHITDAALKAIGGKAACITASKDPSATDPTAKIISTTVSGDTATVKITGKQGAQTIKFTKEDGDWKVDAG